MSEVAIRCEGLGKQYRIGKPERYRTLRDTLTDAMYAPFRRIRSAFQPSSPPASQHPNGDDTIWALKDVSFEIKQGEVVGIIGRNGAGKSTLLKILSRITEPTEGIAEIRGRMGSLLEVGTGFHPELTGRENIYLNGAILGMKKTEIERKFDEIVAFAEVEKFIDTPVKHYSSGMHVRLAFAVAAYLEPEILLVDEVLAVGDAAFQKKCIGKMGDVARQGRTVLFVSHNITAILSLCQRAILLDRGRVLADGTSQNTVSQYFQALETTTDLPLAKRLDRQGNQVLSFLTFELRDSNGIPIPRVFSGQDVIMALKYRSNTDRTLKDVHVAMGVHGRFDETLFHLSTSVNGFEFEKIPPRGMILCKIPRLPLQPGKYSLNVFCTVTGDIADWIQNAGVFEVEAGDFFGSGKLPPPDQGVFMVPHSWGISSTENT